MTADLRESADSVVGVELTIDGALLIASRLGLAGFPATLGIRPNIPDEEMRDLVWAQVARDLADQDVIGSHGQPHPAVAAMVRTLSEPDRTLEGRWWRRDVGDVMVRFVICRKSDQHVIAVRDGDLLVLQVVAPQVGLAGMLTSVLGIAEPADVEPLTAVAADLAECTTEAQLTQLGVRPDSARRYLEITGSPSSWAEITAGQRRPDGSFVQTQVAAGVLDSARGRVVSLPRHVGGRLYGSFLSGTDQNLELSLEGLLQFVPAGRWLDDDETPSHGDHGYRDFQEDVHHAAAPRSGGNQ